MTRCKCNLYSDQYLNASAAADLKPFLCESEDVRRFFPTLLQPPVHDVANQGAGQQAQQLQRAEDGGVEPHWRRKEDQRSNINNHTQQDIHLLL